MLTNHVLNNTKIPVLSLSLPHNTFSLDCALSDLSKTFTSEPTSVEVYLGDTAVFLCRMDGAPTPNVRWFKDGTEIDRDNQRYVIHLDGTLEIGM